MSPARFGQMPGSRLTGRLRSWAAAAVAVAVLPVVSGAAMPAPPHGGAGDHGAGPNIPRAVPAMRAVPVHPIPARRVRVPVMRAWRRPAVTWPAAGAATAVISAPGSVRAGSLPVWVGPPVTRPDRASAWPARVGVRMLPRRLAGRLGVAGVVFTLARADGRSGAAAVHVSLDFRSFAYAAGGDFATRLHLVELPACALTTPGVAACTRQAPLPSADDALRFWLGADVTLPGSSASAAKQPRVLAPGPQVVLAATTAPAGSGGDFTATPLSEAGTWQAGGSSGAFTYDVPIAVPPVPGGLAPDVALMYDSQAVDGLTSATNSQASWIGDGWNYQPGYIERDYQSCEQTSAKTGDLCWSGNNVTTLSLGGRTTTLVDDSSSGWHAEADSGDKVQYQTGTSNGTNDNGYWVITDPSGTKYYFGLNQLPGWATGDATTNSAWTVPVYAASSGQPCYDSTFSKSHCQQAWRWNLDYVVDAHSDAEALFYKTATNYYAANKGTTGTASYVRAGALTKIEYGLRDGAIYGVTPAGQVNFTTVTTRTDIPSDLSCSSGASCDVISPTFWSKYQLTTISTQGLEGSALASVDQWDLSQSFPSTGDGTSTPPLWLDKIQRTGQDGTAVTLPPVKFAGIAMPNRAETPADQQDGYSLYDRFRLTSVTSETGGVTAVTYDDAPTSCTSGNFPPEDGSTTVCYPDWWTPPGASSPILDWFNKYVVTGITQSNAAGGATPVTTRYCYGSTSNCLSSAAWHYNDDALTRSKNRTWDQWRGFGTVYTYTGTAPDPVTETRDRFFQGMDGNFQSGGSTSSASLASTLGSQTVTDSPQFAAMSFEHTVYDGSGGAVVSDTVTVPWTSGATATQSQPSPLPALKAFMTGTAQTKSFTALAAGGNQEADTTYTHDSLGRVASVSDVPDVSDPSHDTCTTTSYPSSTSNWILDLPSEVQVVAKPCGTTATLPQDAVNDTRYFYDGSSTLGAEPSKGDLTKTQLATSYSGSTPSYTTESKKAYDGYGRVTSASDADNRTTTTAYSPSSGAEPTSVTVTDPMNLATTTTYDPARDLPLTVTNPAGLVTTKQYDSLGRLTAAWTPGHATSGPADATFSYTVSQTAASTITVNTITASGSQVPSITLFDSLGRQFETQTQTPDGGRDIADTFYNSDGWKVLASDPYYTTGAPSATPVQAGSGQVPSQTGWFYDGAGRVVRQVAYSLAAETWETDTAYGGNYTTVTPPAGGTSQTTYTDGRGLTQFIYQYHGTPPASPPAPGSGSKSGPSGWNQTSYTYTPARRLATVTDAVGNQWSYAYDLAGDTVSQSDPDSGDATMTYDSAGQLMSVTDARGKAISYTYDADGRKTAKYDTTGGATQTGSDQVAAWTYDTLAKGQLTSSVAYGPGGTSGTTYTQAITGYNTYGLPSGTSTAISAGPLAGTYKRTIGYTSYANLVSANHDFAAGNLPDEQINYSYNGWNAPSGVSSSLWTYVASLTYTELGQPQEYAFGTTTSPAWLTNTYDQQTGRLNEAMTQTGSQSGKAVTVDDTSYAYDNFGDITSEADTPPSGPSQVQCYHYDYLARLTQAWSQAVTPCAASPSQSAEGGAAPYWNSYAYDPIGNLTGVTSTPQSGQATVTTSTFPAAGSPQPHAPASQAVTGPSGNSTTSFSYDASGHLTASSGGTSQTLAWDDTGRFASDRTAVGTTSYVYDADGNLLLQTDPGGVTTLYLPDEQITTDGTTTSGVRYYALGGVTVAARASSGSVSYLTADQHGTANLAIDSQSLAVTRRYYDPYGNPIGAQPSSWPGTRGFVGGTADSATGLTNLGAREYSAAAGEFITPDPVINPYVPQDLNGYAYASDDPVTYSDPTGLVCIPDFCVRPGSGGGGGGHGGGGHGGSGGGGGGVGCCGGGGGGGGGGGRTYPTAPPPNPKVLEITHVIEMLDPPIRVETPHQVATGAPGCNSVVYRLVGGACTVPTVKGGMTWHQWTNFVNGGAAISGVGALIPGVDVVAAPVAAVFAVAAGVTNGINGVADMLHHHYLTGSMDLLSAASDTGGAFAAVKAIGAAADAERASQACEQACASGLGVGRHTAEWFGARREMFAQARAWNTANENAQSWSQVTADLTGVGTVMSVAPLVVSWMQSDIGGPIGPVSPDSREFNLTGPMG